MSKFISVWLHKKTGQIWEHLPTSLGGFAITRVDIDAKTEPFTDWHDWQERGLWHFDDEKEYNPDNFIDLGEL